MSQDSATAAGLRTIVLGVDGSRGAQRALQWAAARSQESGADLVAVHVLTYSREFVSDLPPTGLTNWRRTLGDKLAGPWTEPARAAGVKVRTAVVEDDSACAGLLAAGADEHADLIVLGTHGHGNLADRLMGATTYQVTHRAPVPVVIVPPVWTPGA